MKRTSHQLVIVGLLLMIGVTLLVFARNGFSFAEVDPTIDQWQSNPSLANAVQDSVIQINDVSFQMKRPDFGGEACVAMYARHLGKNTDQNAVFNMAGVDPTLGRGCIASELATLAKKMGFHTGPAWYRIDHAKQSEQFEILWSQLAKGLGQKHPSVFCIQQNGIQQFVLVLGINKEKGTVIFHDPAIRDGQYRELRKEEFFEKSKLRNPNDVSGNSSSVVKIDLRIDDASNLFLAQSTKKFTAADYAQHIRKLKTKLPNSDFKFLIQEPFVVIGDEELSRIKSRSKQTIKWAVDKLKAEYFQQDPKAILDVWLFKDKASYDKHNVELFGDKPTTPYGYYSPSNRSLVMNISTGGGTLVHEIVHPFIESNFEDCPSWFNEGLGSLYEQCSERNGRIMGSTNWRLAGLQRAIRNSNLQSFETLCKTTRSEFYGDARGTNYAMARYLCYYLQEQGLLHKFYHQFHKNVDTDPSGYDTLQDVLGKPDMTAFQKRWEDYVSNLRFPN